MSSEADIACSRRIPSLVKICQWVASAHVESMCSIGDDVPIDLVRPILKNCPAEVLDKLEQSTPSLCKETSEMWKALCFRAFPLTAEQHFTAEQPESWRAAYFRLKDFEKERLDAVAAKLRVKREEERRRKEDSQIKFTDKLPPAKRSRGSGWGQSQPKTLFQKTRSDAAKLHNGIYGARIPPPMQIIKSSRSVLATPGSFMAKPATSPTTPGSSSMASSGTRVTVSSVPKNRTPVTSRPPTESASGNSSSTKPATHAVVHPTRSAVPKPSPGLAASVIPRVTHASPPPPLPVEARVDLPKVRKDPMTTIFMRKPRSYPLVPTHSASMRSDAR